jgi:hypothetical protein
MRLVRLPLVALALIALAACSNDATGPDFGRKQEAVPVSPSQPRFNDNGYMGSGLRASPDSTQVAPAVDMAIDSAAVLQ